MTWPGTEPRSPGSLANTLPTRPMRRGSYKFTWWVNGVPNFAVLLNSVQYQWSSVYIYIYIYKLF